MGFINRRAARLAAVGLAAACLAAVAEITAFSTPASADGRTIALVSPIESDPALAGRLPPTYSPDALRRELEVALETTGLFTVPSRDKHDLDPLLREFAAAKRRPRGDFHMAQLILNPTLEGFDIHERRRRAPMMKSKDALSVVGTFSMTVEVMNVSDGSVQTRMQIDVPYQTAERLTDPLANDPLSGESSERRDIYNGNATPEELKAAYEAVGRAFATRVADQVYPALVAQRTGDRIYITRGEDAGYQVGDVLQIIRRGEPIRNPVTHEVIGTAEQPVGEAKVVQVLPRMTIAQVTTASADVAIGDIVRAPVAGADN